MIKCEKGVFEAQGSNAALKAELAIKCEKGVFEAQGSNAALKAELAIIIENLKKMLC